MAIKGGNLSRLYPHPSPLTHPNSTRGKREKEEVMEENKMKMKWTTLKKNHKSQGEKKSRKKRERKTLR